MRRVLQVLFASVGVAVAVPAAGAAVELQKVGGERSVLGERDPWTPLGPGLLDVYVDPANDQVGASAATTGDITVTTTTNTASTVTWDVDVLNVPTVRAGDFFELLIDTDQNGTTGDPTASGAEILLQINGGAMAYFIGRYNATSQNYQSIAAPSTSVQWGSGPIIALSRTELAITTPGINFIEDTVWAPGTPPVASGFDFAPNGTAVYPYTFTAAPPPPPSPPPAPPPAPPPPPPPPPDTRAPNTVITGGISGRTARRVATFRFRSTEAGSTFQCKLDRRAWGSCRSPKTYRGLRPGSHTFRVRAKDRAGNQDRTPARRVWTIRRAT